MAKFEEQLTELEKIVTRLESGSLTLEESVKLFEQGVKLSEGCKTELLSAESRIQALLRPTPGGPVRVEDIAVEDQENEVLG